MQMPERAIKVCYVAAGFPAPAGIEAHIAHYACEMKGRGCITGVRVFAPLPQSRHRFMLQMDRAGISLQSVGPSGWLVSFSFAFSYPCLSLVQFLRGKDCNAGLLRSWIYGKLAARRWLDYVRNEAPDIIHVFGRLPPNIWGLLPADKTIYHEMMTGTDDGSWDAPEKAAFEAFANKCVHLLAPGDGVARNLKSSFYIQRPIESVYTICPEISPMPAFPRKPHTPLRFGIVCRFEHQKGILPLLNALRNYQSKHGTVNFVFAGHGILEAEMKDFVSKHELKNVQIMSVGERLHKILESIDVFVHPSVDDAMPVSLAEALMFGIPVIASRVGGIPDLIRDGREGILIDPADERQIEGAMDRFEEMVSGEYSGFSSRARARYEEGPEKVGSQIERIYGAVAGGQRAEDGGQMAEIGGQTADDRQQMTDDGGQGAEIG